MLLCLVGMFASVGFASEPAAAPAEGQAEAASGELSTTGKALAAALAVGLCAFGTGIAMGRIGSAGCGTIAERPESLGSVIILLAIPETMIILGFVVAAIILFV